MKIDLTDLLKETGNTQDIKERVDISYPEDGLVTAGPVGVDIRLLNAGEVVVVEGHVVSDIRLSCDRCLKEFTGKLAVDFEEHFSRDAGKTRVSAEKEAELDEKDFVYPIEADNTIDLTEMIRQELISSLPIRSLCSDTCSGIQGYRKEGKKTDPRLEKLKEDYYNARTQKKTQQHKDEPKKKG